MPARPQPATARFTPRDSPTASRFTSLQLTYSPERPLFAAAATPVESGNGDSAVVAVLTPFQRSGRIDYAALTDYLQMLASAGVGTILVNGTSAEFAGLTSDERRSVVEHCRSEWVGTVIAHVGSTAVADVRAAARHAEEPADAVAVVAPYFFAEAPESGVEQFFRQAMTGIELPWLVYNFPRHTGNPVRPAVVARLAGEFPQLVGIKDSGKDLAVARAYKTGCPRLSVLVGDDRAAARLAALGLDGVVTGAGGPVAELPVTITAAARAGDEASARSWQRVFDTYSDTRKAMGLSDIAFAKAAAATRLPGFPLRVRAPLTGVDEQQRTRIERFLRTQTLPAIDALRVDTPH
ncbi:dihydrodipicolinate synthase family protein [Nocardia abscessus]|uniref:dihydrodipicolinate synthase family protein n=1 Tax=Nocardia abscessus TaxID=120957 RepID=UPI0024582EAB|nr:dihydrodipicolinate synthase family protein [Nocardia abscessus]